MFSTSIPSHPLYLDSSAARTATTNPKVVAIAHTFGFLAVCQVGSRGMEVSTANSHGQCTGTTGDLLIILRVHYAGPGHLQLAPLPSPIQSNVDLFFFSAMEGGAYYHYTAVPQGLQVLYEGQTGTSLSDLLPYPHRQFIAEARPLIRCDAPLLDNLTSVLILLPVLFRGSMEVGHHTLKVSSHW